MSKDKVSGSFIITLTLSNAFAKKAHGR